MMPEETPKKKYTVAVSYTIQTESETEANALREVMFQAPYEQTVAHLALRVVHCSPLPVKVKPVADSEFAEVEPPPETPQPIVGDIDKNDRMPF